MLEIYLSRNTSRNQKLFNFCRSHDISYTCKDVGHLAHEIGRASCRERV